PPTESTDLHPRLYVSALSVTSMKKPTAPVAVGSRPAMAPRSARAGTPLHTARVGVVPMVVLSNDERARRVEVHGARIANSAVGRKENAMSAKATSCTGR